jgi:hypothetical protein
MFEHDPEHVDANEDTRSFLPDQSLGSPHAQQAERGESLFETYDRRSLRSIIDGQRSYQESQAAQAARAILDGAEIPEFVDLDQDTAEYAEFESQDTHSPRIRRLRVQRSTPIGRLAGTLALALSTDSPHLLLIGGVATPMLLPICVWRWFCWLDSSPYYYRLLTTLGEDARNLLEYRLLWKKRLPLQAVPSATSRRQ